MTPCPQSKNLLEVASRVIWFEAAEKTLHDPIRFLADAFRYATLEDMVKLREEYSDNDLREALAKAPAGIIDPRSWPYWHAILGTFPPPPMPKRDFATMIDPFPTLP